MTSSNVPKELQSIKESLYTKNSYGLSYQDPAAKLNNTQIEYLRTNYGIDKDETLHRMCINCQARQLIKYYGQAGVNDEPANTFHVTCEGVPKSFDISRTALSNAVETSGIDLDTAHLYLKSTYDPVAWVSLMFGFSDNDPKWFLRNYQKEQLRCSALRLVIREGRRCLAEGTPILMADGSWKAIENIIIDDEVISEVDGKPGVGKVVRCFDNGVQPTWTFTFSNGSKLTATSNHPFLKKDGTQLLYQSLEEGLAANDIVLSYLDNNWQEVVLLNIEQNKMTQTYDIEVKEHHSFVAEDIVNHNSGKTFAIALKLLYLVFNKTFAKGRDFDGKEVISGAGIMIVTPYQSQLTNIFDEMESILKRNKHLSSQCTTGTAGNLYVKTPFTRMEFSNGASIYGFVSGVGNKTDGSGGGTMRGQCLSKDTKILMSDNTWKKISEVQVGEYVQSNTPGGLKNAAITKVFEPNTKQLYLVTLASGRTIEASADHQFYGSADYFQGWYNLKDYCNGDYLALSTNFNSKQFDASGDEMYFAGLGAFKVFNARNYEALFGFNTLTHNLGISTHTTMLPNGTAQIRISDFFDVQAFKKKFFNGDLFKKEVLFSSIEQRRLLLGGIIASRGHIQIHNKKPEIHIKATSKQQIEQYQLLLLSLGANAYVYKKNKVWHLTCLKRAAETALFGVHVLGYESENRRVQVKNRKPNYILDKIKSIKPTTKTITYDIEVAETHSFITNGGIMTHNSADVIYLDEMDMIPDDVLDKVVTPILLTTPEVQLIATSTPIGKRGRFYDYCLQRTDFKEDHLPSTVLPHWERIRGEVEKDNSQDAFRAEYLAEFLEGTHGVFKPSYVYSARQDYYYVDCENRNWWTEFASLRNPEELIKVIGIDWNKNAGTEFAVVAYSPSKHFWYVVETTNIPASEQSSIAWKEEVIRLNYKWKPSYIYADEGYGHTIIEDLKLMSYEMKGKPKKDQRDVQTALLVDRLVAFNFSSKVELTSPIDGTKFNKTSKDYLVENAVRIFEDGRVWFPEEDEVLRKQLLNYVVLKRNPTTNKPIYGPENDRLGDHRLDAFMLALVGLNLEYSVYRDPSNDTPSAPVFISKQSLDERSAIKSAPSLLDVISNLSGAPDERGVRRFNALQSEVLKAIHKEEPAGRSNLHSKRSSVYNHYQRTVTKSSFDDPPMNQEADSLHLISRRKVAKRTFGRRK